MENNIFAVAGIISFTYLIFKFIEMRFIEKENKPLKALIKDSLVVYFSVLLGTFVLDQIQPITASPEALAPPVFTGNPEF